MSSRSALTGLVFDGVAAAAAGGTTDERAIVRRRDPALAPPELPTGPPPLSDVASMSGRVRLRAGVVLVRDDDEAGESSCAAAAAARGIGSRPRIEPVDSRGRLLGRSASSSTTSSGRFSGSSGRPAVCWRAGARGLGDGFDADAAFPAKANDGGATRETTPRSWCAPSRPSPLSATERGEGPNVLVVQRGRFDELGVAWLLLLLLVPAAVGAAGR